MNAMVIDGDVHTKKLREINPFVLMTALIILVAALSYVVPAGKYGRIQDPRTHMTTVVPGSYHTVAQTPVGVGDLFVSIPMGMVNGAMIIFMIFIVGGTIGVLEGVGTINAVIYTLVRRFRGKEILLLPVVMFAMAVGGATGAISNTVLAFIPLGIIIARSLKFDPIVGLSMMYLGAFAGFNTGPIVPFTVGLSHQIGQMTVFSGAGVRSLVCFVTIVVTILYVCRYALKVREDPAKSLVVDLNLKYDFDIDLDAARTLQTKDWWILLAVAVAMVGLVYGSIYLGWSFTHISALFVAIAVVTGFIGGFGPNRIASTFVKGMAGITGGAMVCGFAYAIQYVLEKGSIIDTIIFHLAQVIVGLPVYVAALGMYVANILLHFVIPSGSGQAVAVMPIMFPIADLVGMTRQVAVQAYQLGDGFSNGIAPSSGVIMAGLAIAKIPYSRWARFYLPLLGWWSIIAVINLFLAIKFNWGA